MKTRAVFLSIFLSLVTIGHAFADSVYPEINVKGSPDQVMAWFQQKLASAGAVQRSSSPGVAVFETPPTMVHGMPAFKSYMMASNIPGGFTGVSIERITINACLSGSITHVVMAVDHVMNYGSPYARNQFYAIDSDVHRGMLKTLKDMKNDVEADDEGVSRVSGVERDPASRASRASRVVNYAAGMGPVQ